MRGPESFKMRAFRWRAAPRSQPIRLNLTQGRIGAVLYSLAVPERRGLGEDGAENGGDAEEGQGAEAHTALPHLMIEINWGVGWARAKASWSPEGAALPSVQGRASGSREATGARNGTEGPSSAVTALWGAAWAMQTARPGDGAPPLAGPGQICTAAVALADLEGGACSALEGAASCDMIFLSAAALVLICLAAAAFFAAFFAAILARYLSAILSATFNAHLAASLLLFRKVFGTSKVPNLLCCAKTPWSCRVGRKEGGNVRTK